MIVLASASPRRRALLAEYGYQFIIDPADVNEIAPAHLTPREIVLWNAHAKALAVSRRHTQNVVLGVDTLVALDDRVLGKPRDLDDAVTMLESLNGRIHEVFTGVCLFHSASGQLRTFSEVTRVHFHRLTPEKIRAYLRRIGPLDKAGAYAAQDDRGELIARVEGSFSNVVGLPMERLAVELMELTNDDSRSAS